MCLLWTDGISHSWPNVQSLLFLDLLYDVVLFLLVTILHSHYAISFLIRVKITVVVILSIIVAFCELSSFSLSQTTMQCSLYFLRGVYTPVISSNLFFKYKKEDVVWLSIRQLCNTVHTNTTLCPILYAQKHQTM